MIHSEIATLAAITKAAEALTANGIEAIVVEDAAEAKKALHKLIPKGSEVMDYTSMTLEKTGIAADIAEKYTALRPKLYSMDRATEGKEMNRMGAAPDFAVGSVHAITLDGQLVIASNTGSQLPAYAYGAGKVIWVVGAQKIVKNLDEAMDRIYDYVLPLESERAKVAYGVPGSNVSKLLIINKEVNPKRATIIIVKEVLGF